MWADPSGLEIVLASNTTDAQRAAFERAIEYLKQSETFRELWNILQYGGEIITIAFTNDHTMLYRPSTRTIYWDPTSGLVLGDRLSVQSAAIGLAHEMGHAAQHLQGNNYFMESIARPGNRQLLFRMENDNIARFESPIAKELGEFTRSGFGTSSGTHRMRSSTHWGTVHTLPMWLYINPRMWRQPRRIVTNENTWTPGTSG